MTLLEIPTGVAEVVCIGAHADDIEIGIGGTLLAMAEALPEARFTFVVLSAEGQRAGEAEASAHDLLGDRCSVRTGSFADNLLPYAEPVLVKSFLREAVPPVADLVFTPRRDDRHQDHRFAADLAGQVIRSGLFLQYEIVNNDRDLGQPNAFIPLASEVIEAKVDHLMAHFESQQNKAWYLPDVFRSMARVRGVQSGAPGGYAEAFILDAVSIGIGS